MSSPRPKENPAYLYARRLVSERGWAVFPVQRNGKLPIKDTTFRADGRAGEGQTNVLCRTEAEVDAMHGLFPEANWALHTGASGVAVVDVDNKPLDDGSNVYGLGYKTWDSVVAKRGFPPDTLTHGTVSDGEHLIYSDPGGAVRTSQGDKGGIGPGVDTRAAGNAYVLIPGSAVNGKTYVVKRDAPAAPAPSWLAAMLGESKQELKTVSRTDDAPNAVVDLAYAVHYLENVAPVSVEGEAGSLTAVDVAARLRDYGISEAVALDLMTSHWNDRCEPPWEKYGRGPDALQARVASAYSRTERSMSPGAASLTCFPPVYGGYVQPEVIDGPQGPVAARFRATLTDGCTLSEADIPKKLWVMRPWLSPGYVSVIISPGGLGKSTLAMLQAAAVLTGRADLMDREVQRPGPVLVYNLEDPIDEMQRKYAAIRKEYGVTAAEGYYMVSGQEDPLRIVTLDDRGNPHVQHDAIDALVGLIKEKRIVHICVDPVVRLHTANENDNSHMDEVVRAFTLVCKQTGCSATVVHHSRKQGKEGAAGDVETSRGASAFTNAARSAYTLTRMSEKEADTYGIPQADRRAFFRMDEGKNNLAPAAGRATWFQLKSVSLENGDSVGVAVPAHMEGVGAGPPLIPDDLWSVLETHVPVEGEVEVSKILKAEHPKDDKARRALREKIKYHLPENLEVPRNGRFILRRKKEDAWVVYSSIAEDGYYDL